MYSYIIAKVISINKKSITVETKQQIGYVINVSDIDDFVVGEERKIYLYQHLYLNNKNSIIEDLYGFVNYEQKLFFLDCIAISGIGTKTAIGFLKNSLEVIKQLIVNKDIDGLANLPGISKKVAYILIDYLASRHMEKMAKNNDFTNMGEVINVLKTLGYSEEDINFALAKIMAKKEELEDNETSSIVGAAIKLISLKNEAQTNKAE